MRWLTWRSTLHFEGSNTRVHMVCNTELYMYPVDALPSGSVMVGEVSSLAHEVRNHTVEEGSFLVKRFA